MGTSETEEIRKKFQHKSLHLPYIRAPGPGKDHAQCWHQVIAGKMKTHFRVETCTRIITEALSVIDKN